MEFNQWNSTWWCAQVSSGKGLELLFLMSRQVCGGGAGFSISPFRPSLVGQSLARGERGAIRFSGAWLAGLRRRNKQCFLFQKMFLPSFWHDGRFQLILATNMGGGRPPTPLISEVHEVLLDTP